VVARTRWFSPSGCGIGGASSVDAGGALVTAGGASVTASGAWVVVGIPVHAEISTAITINKLNEIANFLNIIPLY
jgi:hypothetical protein